MANMVRRGSRNVEPFDFFDQTFGDWVRLMPFRPGLPFRDAVPDDLIRVDEYEDGDALVIRAEMPGIDPDKDVEVTVSGGMLHIHAERRQEENKDEKGYRHRELRYGSFSRSLPLPDGAQQSDVTADFKDGMLEIRVPIPQESATKVPVTKK
jgi:HSP20 family protein